MANISEVILKLLDEKNWETLTGVDAIPSFAMDAVVLLKEQNERIEKMCTLLGEADEEIRELKVQNRPGFGG